VKDVGGGIKVASVRDPFGNLFGITPSHRTPIGQQGRTLLRASPGCATAVR
jgi:hypothetical protein